MTRSVESLTIGKILENRMFNSHTIEVNNKNREGPNEPTEDTVLQGVT